MVPQFGMRLSGRMAGTSFVIAFSFGGDAEIPYMGVIPTEKSRMVSIEQADYPISPRNFGFEGYPLIYHLISPRKESTYLGKMSLRISNKRRDFSAPCSLTISSTLDRR